MRKALALILSLLAGPACAGTIVQSGSVTPGHVGQWTTTGVLQDGGPATAGTLTELGITKNGGNGLCVNSAKITGPYNELCIGASTSGAATISLQNLGGAAAEPLNIIVDGNTVLSLSSATTGLVTATGTPTTSHCAIWTGALSIGDSGGACGGSLPSIANNTILGNNTGSTGPAIALTREQVNSMLSLLDNVVSEGADPTGTADSTTAINTALATCGAYIPPGTYKITGTGLTTGSCTSITIIGGGSSVTTLKQTATTGKVLNNGATNGLIQGLTFDRSGTPAVAGAVGLSMAGVTNDFTIQDILSQNQYDGIELGPSANGFARNVISQSNFHYGFSILSLFFNGAVQWTLHDTLAQFNNSWGYYVAGNFAGVTQLVPWDGVTSFANTAGGIALVGSSGHSIEGFQLSGGVINNDGGDEIQLTTFAAGPVFVSNSGIALAGVSATGRAQATSASHTGNGINVTGSNPRLVLTENWISGNSFAGVAVQSGALLGLDSTANTMELNGAASPGSTYAGLAINTALTATITGGMYGNRNGSTQQAYGINVLDGTNITIQGINVPSNNVAGVVAGSNIGVMLCTGVQGESMTTIGCNQGGGGGGGSVNFQQSTVASSSTTDLSAGGTNLVSVTGNATINSFGSGASTSSPIYIVTFSGNATLVESFPTMALPGVQNIVTAPNDQLVAQYVGSGHWLVLNYQHNNGQTVTPFGASTNIASATTTNLGAAGNGNFLNVTGTTTITSFGSSASLANPLYMARFAGVLTITYNGASLLTPGATNITTAAGDAALLQYLGSGNWQVLSYFPAAGAAASGVTSATGSGLVNVSPTTGAATVSLSNISDSNIVGNITGGSAAPAASNITTFLDHAFGNSVGAVLVRNGIGWGEVQLTNNTVLGNLGSNNVALTQTQLTALVNAFSTSLSGAVPASGGGTTNFLRADGTWHAPAGSGTVTSVTCGSNMSGGTITAAGTCDVVSNPTFSGLITESAGSAVASGQTTSYGGAGATISGNGSVLSLHSSFTTTTDASTFGPAVTNSSHLGNTGDVWIDVWATNNTIQTSDRREKKNIQPTDLGLAFIDQLTPISYEWKDPKPGLGTHYGLIAQDLEKVLAGKSFAGLHVPTADNERYGLAYDELIAPLIKGEQELHARIVRDEAIGGAAFVGVIGYLVWDRRRRAA